MIDREARARAVERSRGEKVATHHAKEEYYAMVGRLTVNLFSYGFELESAVTPRRFEMQLAAAMYSKMQREFTKLTLADRKLTQEAFVAYKKRYVPKGGEGDAVLDNLRDGTHTAATIGTVVPWTLYLLNNEAPVSEDMLNGSFRIHKGLMRSYISTVATEIDRCSEGTSSRGFKENILPDDYTLNNRGLWLPKKLHEPSAIQYERNGPHLGCPFAFNPEAVKAYTGYLRDATVAHGIVAVDTNS